MEALAFQEVARQFDQERARDLETDLAQCGISLDEADQVREQVIEAHLVHAEEQWETMVDKLEDEEFFRVMTAMGFMFYVGLCIGVKWERANL